MGASFLSTVTPAQLPTFSFLPVYSLVQGVVPFPWCLVIYILGFTLAAYLMLLAAMGIRKLAQKKESLQL